MSEKAGRVRNLEPKDRASWVAMWRQFLHDKPDEPGDRQTEVCNWERMMDAGNPLRCIVAVDENDVPKGFTLFVALPFTWSRKDICYLEDIYVDPDSRGQGYATAMMYELVELGRNEEWFKIFWMTESDNVRAQRFYERLAQRMDYLRYDLNIEDAGS